CLFARRASIKKLALSLDLLSWSTPMKALRLRILLPIATLLLICGNDAAWAQAPLEPAQMSPRTAFYLIWRGVPGAQARKNNSLLALWDDPDFAPVRSALLEQIEHGSARSSKASKPVTPEEFTEFAGLLDNELVLGAIEEAAPAKVSKGATVTAAHKW